MISYQLASAVCIFFFAINPFEKIGLFNKMIALEKPSNQFKVIVREICCSFLAVGLFYFLSSYIIKFTEAEPHQVAFATGVVLVFDSLKLILTGKSTFNISLKDKLNKCPIFAPVATPLIIGVSPFAIITLFKSCNQELSILALMLGCALSAIVFFFAKVIEKNVNSSLIEAFSRFIAFVTTAIGVKIIISAFKMYNSLT